jgi:hypothetical protein
VGVRWLKLSYSFALGYSYELLACLRNVSRQKDEFNKTTLNCYGCEGLQRRGLPSSVLAKQDVPHGGLAVVGGEVEALERGEAIYVSQLKTGDVGEVGGHGGEA